MKPASNQPRRIPDGTRAFAAYRSMMMGGTAQDYRNILRTLRDGNDQKQHAPIRKGRKPRR